MPNKTSKIGLNQWEGSDQVLRSDFNEDNAVLETVLTAQQSQLEELEQGQANLKEKEAQHYFYLSNALHEVALLQDADSWYTGEKSGLILDAFSGYGRIQSYDDGVMAYLEMPGLLVGSVVPLRSNYTKTNLSYQSSSTAAPYRQIFENDRCGIVKTIKMQFNHSGTQTFAFDFYSYNSKTAQKGRKLSSRTVSVTNANAQLTVSLNCYVDDNDFMLEIYPVSVSTNINVTNASELTFAQCTVAKTTLKSINYPFSHLQTGKVHARARSQGGAVQMSLVSGSGARYPLTLVSSQEGVNVDGRSCTEWEFYAEGISELDGSVRVELELTCDDKKGMELLNYSVIFV